MKKGLTYLFVAGVAVLAVSTSGIAGSDHKMDKMGKMGKMEGHITGEVTKVEGDMVTVKDEHGKEHMLHVDSKATHKEGDIKVGAHVEAEAEPSGHAKSISVHKVKKH